MCNCSFDVSFYLPPIIVDVPFMLVGGVSVTRRDVTGGAGGTLGIKDFLGGFGVGGGSCPGAYTGTTGGGAKPAPVAGVGTVCMPEIDCSPTAAGLLITRTCAACPPSSGAFIMLQ